MLWIETGMIFMTNKTLALATSLILLSSCETPLPLYKAIYDAGSEFASNVRDKQISSDTLDDINYAFIRASIGKGSSKSILILSREQEGILEWISESSEKIYTLNGKIVKTQGLSHDINIINLDALADFPQLDQTSLLVNFYEPALYSQIQNISLASKGLTTVMNPVKGGKDIQVELLIEKVDMNRIFWKTKNRYYINISTGLLERTEQTIHPDLPPISIDFIRKYN